MSVKEQEKIQEKYYSEAMRYMDNAKESLKKANKEGMILHKSYAFFLTITMLLLGIGCDSIVDEEPIPVFELNSGYSIQLTASPNALWKSENPSVATVSSTGLVTAVQAGKTTIYTYSTNGAQQLICHLEVFARRNILMYIGTDTNGLDNGSAGDEPKNQINEIRKGWQPDKGELLIFTDQTNRRPCLMRIKETLDADGFYAIDTLHIYEEKNSADAAVLNEVIRTMVNEYPADCYGMIFFSHSSGWFPEGMLNSPRSLVIDKGEGVSREMSYENFAAAIPDNQFDFMIFEACFMADAISMYELRNKSKYILASSAEIVSPGFYYVYKDQIMRLFDTKNTIETIVTDFGKAYTDIIQSIPENNVFCSTTLGLIKLSEMDQLAATVKAALHGVNMDESTLNVDSIQRFDRPNKLITYSPRKSRYFDLGHVVENLASPVQYAAFLAQMNKTVVWKENTKRFLLGDYSINQPYYSEYDGFFIKRHCGLTTYIERDVYPNLNLAFRKSAWYKAIYD